MNTKFGKQVDLEELTQYLAAFIVNMSYGYLCQIKIKLLIIIIIITI